MYVIQVQMDYKKFTSKYTDEGFSILKMKNF